MFFFSPFELLEVFFYKKKKLVVVVFFRINLCFVIFFSMVYTGGPFFFCVKDYENVLNLMCCMLLNSV